MFDFGSIVMVAFPFTDLSNTKVRPALVVSKDNVRRSDVVLAFISSRGYLTEQPDTVALFPTPENGLKVSSVVRFDKLITLEKRIVLGEIGIVSSSWLISAAPVFHNVFGFNEYQAESADSPKSR